MYVGNEGDDRKEKADLDDPARGVQGKGECDADSIQHPEVRSLSRFDEHEPERTDRTLGEEFGGERRTPNIGKMLRQLKQIRQAHLAYVEAHGQRLETRLKENREHHQKILEEINDLEDELTKLLGQFEEDEASE